MAAAEAWRKEESFRQLMWVACLGSGLWREAARLGGRREGTRCQAGGRVGMDVAGLLLVVFQTGKMQGKAGTSVVRLLLLLLASQAGRMQEKAGTSVVRLLLLLLPQTERTGAVGGC